MVHLAPFLPCVDAPVDDDDDDIAVSQENHH